MQPGEVLRRYEAMHLASFTSSARLAPEEAVYKLQQMEDTTGVWEMPCSLLLAQSAVVVADRQSGELMEQFQLPSVREPAAFNAGTNQAASDNLVLFSVVQQQQQQQQQRQRQRAAAGGSWEIHIFRSLAAPAAQVANEISRLLAGDRLDSQQQRQLQQQQQRQRQQQQQQQQQRQQRQQQLRWRPAPDGRRASAIGDDSERLVHILNRCFEEIEQFAGQLSATARAGERLRADDGSAGLLRMRAQLPPSDKFVDILKKLKLSLNLLGRLEGRIHSPNSPELVHALFAPLALIVHSLGGVDLPSRVLSPLLTPQTVSLLKHCLDSKEAELWHSLGPTWTQHRARWLQQRGDPSVIPDYRPCFQDGWQPQLEPELLGQAVGAEPQAFGQARQPQSQQQRPAVAYWPATSTNQAAASRSADRQNGQYGFNFPDARRQPISAEFLPENDDIDDGSDAGSDFVVGGESTPQLWQQAPPAAVPPAPPPPPPPPQQQQQQHQYRQQLRQQQQSPPPQLRGGGHAAAGRQTGQLGGHAAAGRPTSQLIGRIAGSGGYSNIEAALANHSEEARRRQAAGQQPPANQRRSHSPLQQQQQPISSWDEQQQLLRREAERRGNQVAQAIHDKEGRNAKELTVRSGELLEVLDNSRNWWQLRNSAGEVGHAPYTILRLL